MALRTRFSDVHSRRFMVEGLMYLAAVLCLLWPALLNSQYIMFYDTSAYLRYPAQAFKILFGVESEWTALFQDIDRASDIEAAAGSTRETELTKQGPEPAKEGIKQVGRSIYYGAMLYVSELAASLWLGLLFQVFCAALAIQLTLLGFLGPQRRAFPLVLCFLGVATPLSFFVSYLMPDVFAGIAILAVANLLVSGDGLRSWMRWAWFALLCASLAFHTSHIAITILLFAAGAMIVGVARARLPWKHVGLIGAAVILGLLAEVAFSWAVEVTYGHPPLRPPFLMARMIADGPGYDYLRATCPGNGFRICDFLPMLPLEANQILFTKDPDTGVYGAADPETRRHLAQQQMAFVVEVLRYDLDGQILASTRRFLEQLTKVSISEFAYTDAMRSLLLEHLPADHREAFRNSLLFRNEFPIAPVDAVFRGVIWVTGIYLVWGSVRLVFRRDADGAVECGRESSCRTLMLFVAVTLVGLALNAATTGILATPDDRYQSRVIWLVPMLAIIVFLWVKADTARRSFVGGP